MTRSASVLLSDHFSSALQTFAFDLYTVALQSGAVLRWTDADVPMTTTDGRVFSCGPLITRDRITWQRGVTVDELDITIAGGAQFTINGVSLPAFATAGGLDNARIVLERIYLDTALAVKGQLSLFVGEVADVDEITQTNVHVIVKSDLAKLDVQMPRNVYQAPCRNDLYDVRCALSRLAYSVSLSVAAVDANYPRTTFTAAYGGRSTGWFDLGILTVTSGPNAGQSRTVKSHVLIGGTASFQMARGFPFPLTPADNFTVAAGCDKQQATCVTKFGNLPRFRAEPYIPNPETVT